MSQPPDTPWLGFCGFSDQTKRDAIREGSQAKDLQRKNDRGYVEGTWRSPRELVCQVLVQSREEGVS